MCTLFLKILAFVLLCTCIKAEIIPDKFVPEQIGCCHQYGYGILNEICCHKYTPSTYQDCKYNILGGNYEFLNKKCYT
jgi:hypothetical protein